MLVFLDFRFCLRVHFFKKIQDWIVKSERVRNGFFAYLLNRLIQDHSDHGASKELTNPFPEWILQFLINLVSKKTQNLFSDYFGFKNPILDFLKEIHP